MTAPVTPPPVTELAILVVYVVRDDTDLPLLELHLDRVARHTAVPYTIHAVAERVTPRAREILAAAPHVQLHTVAPTDLRGSREHAHYLDALVEIAVASGASHLVTLDLDSFPIADGWVDTLAAAAPPETGLAAILRTENGDSCLPHPSCLLAPRAFFADPTPSFSPDWDGTPEFRRFLRTTGQAGDTGIRIAYRLWAGDEPWEQLRRSNAVDVHHLIAGIYGDQVFHLGATSRGVLFRRDLQQSRIHRLTSPLERAPARGATAVRVKQAALRATRGPTERRMMQRNRAVHAVVREWLLDDPDDLVAYLRGAPPSARAYAALARLATP